ncbi:MAG: heavy-metal-associated domain-containing protein [Candidatus Portnoybacteria bacterium]|nr:heavy-metal-associated domain-containing protein [Candidatus Portnoybacteria bacterium]
MNKNLLLIIIPLVLVGVIGFRLAAKNNESSNAVQKVAVDTKNLHHLAMKIDGMYCTACPYNVENALKDTPGVVNVTVGFVGKEIINGAVEGRGEVVYDATETNPDKMIHAILPYKGAVVNDKATSSTALTPLSKTFGL